MKTKVGLIVIATHNYIKFLTPMLDSAEKFFFSNEREFEVTYFVFTDKRYIERNVTAFYLKHEPWPYITLKRFHAIMREKDHLATMDYLFYCDVDMRFMQFVGSDMLSDFSATIHPYFYNLKVLNYERNLASLAFVPLGEGRRYYAGGFYGGKTECFLSMAGQLQKNIDIDLGNEIIAVWHDESHLNSYLVNKPPKKELDPSYCYPEGQNLPFDIKIMALNKSHQKIRKENSALIDFIRLVMRRILRHANGK